MKIVTSEIMKQIDKYCIKTLNIPGTVLMENAAIKVIDNIDLQKYKSFSVICGKGNNGGDGLAIARHLIVLEKEVDVFLIGTEEGMTDDAKINLNILKSMGKKIFRISNLEDVNDLRDAIDKNDAAIDAIFGTGLVRNVEGIYDQVISVINENSKYTISVDVPSGFESNTGKVLGNCVRANKTVTFQMYKRGFLSYGTDKLTGEIVVTNIGIPNQVIDKFHNKEFIMDKAMIENNLQVRDKYCYKGDYGRVLIMAGSSGFTGAAYIAAQGAVRSGAGLVTLCCSKEIQPVLSTKLVEAMTVPIEDKDKVDELIQKCNAIAVGPGMGISEETREILCNVIRKAKCPIVIDADGINVLKDNLSILKENQSEIILTPHFGEMSNIIGKPIDYIRENRMEVAKKFAKENGVIVLLKGYNTVISDGNVTIINPTGNSSMASGGMGDCLTGMITAFIGQGYKPLQSACIATFIHGYAGESLSKNMFSVNASHILEKIPFVIKEFQK